MNNLEANIFTMTKIVGLVRMLPEEIFSNIETKQNMQAAASEYLDSLIEQECEEEIGEPLDIGNENFGVLGDIGLDEFSQKTHKSTVKDNSNGAPGRNITIRGE